MTAIRHPRFETPVLKVGRISYQNVAPIYHGLDKSPSPDWFRIESAPPSGLNEMLEKGDLDISPVSSAAFARNSKDWLILPDLSISCFGRVMSVLLVSRLPMDDLSGKKVLLTEDSAAAANLLRLLFADKKIGPHFITGRVRETGDIPPDTHAALVIGDAALKENWSEKFPHVFDLGDLWKNRTGLPFVFALFAVRKPVALASPEKVTRLLELFHASCRMGLADLCSIVPAASQKLGISRALCREYYNRLSYGLTGAHIRGLSTYFEGLYREGLLPHRVEPAFFEPSKKRRRGPILSPFFPKEVFFPTIPKKMLKCRST